MITIHLPVLIRCERDALLPVLLFRITGDSSFLPRSVRTPGLRVTASRRRTILLARIRLELAPRIDQYILNVGVDFQRSSFAMIGCFFVRANITCSIIALPNFPSVQSSPGTGVQNDLRQRRAEVKGHLGRICERSIAGSVRKRRVEARWPRILLPGWHLIRRGRGMRELSCALGRRADRLSRRHHPLHFSELPR